MVERSAFASSTETLEHSERHHDLDVRPAGGSLTSGHSYAVVAEATDSFNNTATCSTVDFSYLVKAPPPTVTITYPVNGDHVWDELDRDVHGDFCGGTGAIISKTQLSIEDTTTKYWWNGSAFSASSQTWVTVTGTTTWMYTPSSA